MATIIQIRKDSAASWTSVNPILADGEFGMESGTPVKIKIGDGVTAWNSLTYWSSGGGGVSLYSAEGNADFSVVNGTVHEIPSSTFTADRSADVSALTTESMICNGEQSFRLLFTGSTVYRNGGTVVETEVMSGATIHLKKIGTKIIIIN